MVVSTRPGRNCLCSSAWVPGLIAITCTCSRKGTNLRPNFPGFAKITVMGCTARGIRSVVDVPAVGDLPDGEGCEGDGGGDGGRCSGDGGCGCGCGCSCSFLRRSCNNCCSCSCCRCSRIFSIAETGESCCCCCCCCCCCGGGGDGGGGMAGGGASSCGGGGGICGDDCTYPI